MTVITGDGRNNTLNGTKAADTIFGLGGNDRIDGGNGNDLVIGGPGADNLFSGAGTDRYVFTSVADSTPGSMDLITDFCPNNARVDKIDLSQIDANIEQSGIQHFAFLSYLPLTGAGQLHMRYINGREGYIEASVDNDPAPEFVVHMTDLTHMLLADDFLLGWTPPPLTLPPPVNPTEGTDWIYGTTNPETLHGLGGDDLIFGHELHGEIHGHPADHDLIYGGGGHDELRGGWGNDTVFGDEGADFVYGGTNNDRVFGGNGDDPIVHGDGSNDSCYGGAGDDGVRGGQGTDQLYGGEGNDRFEFWLLTDSNSTSGIDTIRDFDQPGMGHDTIVLSMLDANSNALGDQAFGFIGSEPLTAPGQVNAVRSGAYIIVSANVDSTTTPELSFRILDPNHLLTLQTADFAL